MLHAMNPLTRLRGILLLALACVALLASLRPAAAAELTKILVTNNLAFPAGKELSSRLIVRASHIVIEGNGATLVGPGVVGDTNSLETAGVGILIEGATDVTLRNFNVRAFATGLVVRDGRRLRLRAATSRTTTTTLNMVGASCRQEAASCWRK